MEDLKDVDLINYKDDTYFGGILDVKRHGIGTYIWTNGNKYTGDWQDDKNMAKEHIFGQMEKGMKVIGKMENIMAKAYITIHMAMSMMVILLIHR